MDAIFNILVHPDMNTYVNLSQRQGHVNQEASAIATGTTCMITKSLPNDTCKKRETLVASLSSIRLVAGTGLEPVTFGL
jgi:hypothetical protein